MQAEGLRIFELLKTFMQPKIVDLMEDPAPELIRYAMLEVSEERRLTSWTDKDRMVVP